MSITLTRFISDWNTSILREQQGASIHFYQLCEAIGLSPSDWITTTGEKIVFEQYVQKTSGGVGRADVWHRGHFAWEYKGNGGMI